MFKNEIKIALADIFTGNEHPVWKVIRKPQTDVSLRFWYDPPPSQVQYRVFGKVFHVKLCFLEKRVSHLSLREGGEKPGTSEALAAITSWKPVHFIL